MKESCFFFAILLALAPLVAGNSAHACLYRVWTFDELRDESELVVFAVPIEVHLTDKRSQIGGWVSSLDDRVVPLLGEEVETTFKVLSVWKSKLDSQIFSLLLKKPPERVTPAPGEIVRLAYCGPSYVSFSPQEKSTYLL